MAVEQLRGRVGEFARHFGELLASLDPDAGWCGVFRRRDPEGLAACREGRELPPWDVVEALLHDFAGRYGTGAAVSETARARTLYAGAVAAHDALPGAREALEAGVAAMLREQQAAAERRARLSRLLAAAPTPEAADALRHDLAWARDDHSRATSRATALGARLAVLGGTPHRGDDRGRSPSPGQVGQPYPGPRGRPDAWAGARAAPGQAAGAAPGQAAGAAPGQAAGAAPGQAAGAAPGQAAGAAPGHGATAPHLRPGHEAGPAHPGPGHEVGGALSRSGYERNAAHPRPGHEASGTLPRPGYEATAAHPRPGHEPGARAVVPAEPPAAPDDPGSRVAAHAQPFAASAHPDARAATSAEPLTRPGRPDARAAAFVQPYAAPAHPDARATVSAQPPPAPAPPSSTPRRKRRGSARFAGALDDDGGVPTPVPVPETVSPPGMDADDGRGPRGARFAGSAVGVERPRVAVDVDARADVAGLVERLAGLRAAGRSGEAHVLLVEAAHGPATRFPLLAEALAAAGLGADWGTLLWETAALPAGRLVAVAEALAGAGRGADGERVLRQGVARPADELGRAALDLVAENRHREARALLGACVRVRTPAEAARGAEPDPAVLVPLLLEAAAGVSDQCRWDLLHALRVAGLTG